MTTAPPSGGRAAAAFLLAAAAAPLPFALLFIVQSPGAGLDMLLFVTVFGFPIALLHVGLLALPAYLLLKRRWRITWGNSLLSGLLIGAVPSSLLAVGWPGLLLTAACGAVGGLVFRFVLRPPPRGAAGDELRQTFG